MGVTMVKRQIIIGVIGASSCDEENYKMAQEVGKLIAENDAQLICGGLSGIMEAACKGAFSNGGTTIGILPMSDSTQANEFVTVPIATGMGLSRNTIIAQAADALIAITGSHGTLSEIAFSMNIGKTVVGLETWDIGSEVEKRGKPGYGNFLVAKNAGEAVMMAMEAAKKRRRSKDE